MAIIYCKYNVNKKMQGYDSKRCNFKLGGESRMVATSNTEEKAEWWLLLIQRRKQNGSSNDSNTKQGQN